jgi:Low-density lipoprotein receptor domain class A
VQFQCQNGHCILLDDYCNGHFDCTDGSDEPIACNRNTVIPQLAPTAGAGLYPDYTSNTSSTFKQSSTRSQSQSSPSSRSMLSSLSTSSSSMAYTSQFTWSSTKPPLTSLSAYRAVTSGLTKVAAVSSLKTNPLTSLSSRNPQSLTSPATSYAVTRNFGNVTSQLTSSKPAVGVTTASLQTACEYFARNLGKCLRY